MTVYTFSEARQNFASLLEKAKKEGVVLIKRKDGSLFEVLPITPKGSPLDVKGLNPVWIIAGIRKCEGGRWKGEK